MGNSFSCDSCCTCEHANPTSRFIESKMKENEKKDQRLTKLLFLGPGGSGKSTIFTQLQWLHGNEFNKAQAMQTRPYIHQQIIFQMQAAIRSYLSQDVQDTQLAEAINKVKQCVVYTKLSHDIASAIAYIWKLDQRLKGIFKIHHSQPVLDEHTEYFWNNIERISSPDYIPNKQDIINVRNRTTGIIQKKFNHKDIWFHIFDVGGQKSERKKWMQCFDDVHAIVFVVDVSCYNQVMYESVDKNCMLDSLELFEQTINMERFSNTPIILFLNKTDLFNKKIKDVPVNECPAFNDVGDDMDDEGYLEYIQKEFEARNTKGRQMFVYPTCAMDCDSIERVFEAVTHIIRKKIQSNMNAMGFVSNT